MRNYDNLSAALIQSAATQFIRDYVIHPSPVDGIRFTGKFSATHFIRLATDLRTFLLPRTYTYYWFEKNWRRRTLSLHYLFLVVVSSCYCWKIYHKIHYDYVHKRNTIALLAH